MAEFQAGLRGYRRRDVERFIARLEGTLGRVPLTGPPATAADVRDVRFEVVFRGFRPKPVDDALAAYEAQLIARESPTTPSRPRHAEIDRLTAFIATATFGTVRWRAGYAEREVDVFLDRVITSLRDHSTKRIGAGDVQSVRFSVTRRRAGYREMDVDRFLDRLATRLARLGRP